MPQSDDSNIAVERLKIIEFISRSGNKKAACQQVGISRSQYYVHKRRYEMYGIDGLKNKTPAHNSHPATTLLEVEQQILDLSREHPAWGCNKLCEQLKEMGVTRSAETLRKIIKRKGMETSHNRWLELERTYRQGNSELTLEQVTFVEKINPAFREREMDIFYPGQYLSQAVFSVGYPKRSHKYYFHVVVDAYSSYAFGLLRKSKQTDDAIYLMETSVLPFFRDLTLDVNICLTNHDRVYHDYSYDEFLDKMNITHRHPRARPWTTGFMERFKRTVSQKLFSPLFAKTAHLSFENLQPALQSWLLLYNNDLTIDGYPNYGRTPSERVEEGLSSRYE